MCAEITTESELNNFSYNAVIEGKIKAEPYLNVRATSNTSSEIIATIPNGTLITIKDIIKVGNKDSWYRVSYNGKDGWVSASYVEIASNKLYIDLKDTEFATTVASKEINYNKIKQINFETLSNNVNRVILELNDTSDYKVIQSEGRTITYLALDSNFKLPTNASKDVVLVASNDDKIYIPEDENDENNSDTKNDVSVVEETVNVNSVKYSSSNNKTRIKTDGKCEYNIFTLENPTRVVLDISPAILNVDGPKEITPNNKNLTSIRFSQNEKDVVRVVFDVKTAVSYVVTQKDNELVVELEEKTYKNIEYVNNKTYSTLILKDTDIDYFEGEKGSNDKYNITYSSKKFKSGTGTITVDDDFVEEIVIKSTKISIYGKDDVSYSMKQKGDDVYITIKQETKKSETNRVILLDAGHGGTDPGTHNGDIYEKIYNLKIALKLYDLLNETDGIEVRISRDSDVYMDREDRLEFILDNKDDADLFVSIHNNAVDTTKNPENKNVKGTMVLYYNKPNEKEDYGITSKEFAQIVKDHLVDELETVDKGIVYRDDQWVLTQNNLGQKPEWESANIPSILCEVIFLSNDEEAARLITDEFQEQTAEAIYDGIMEAISIMDENN